MWYGLPCGHIFCGNCTTRLSSERSQGRCGACRWEFRRREVKRVYLPQSVTSAENASSDVLEKLRTLEAQLAESQRTVNTLKNDLQREKAESVSLRLQLQREKASNVVLQTQLNARNAHHTSSTHIAETSVVSRSSPSASQSSSYHTNHHAGTAALTSSGRHPPLSSTLRFEPSHSAPSRSAEGLSLRDLHNPPYSPAVIEPQSTTVALVLKPPIPVDLGDIPCNERKGHYWDLRGCNGKTRQYTCTHCSLQTSERVENGKWTTRDREGFPRYISREKAGRVPRRPNLPILER